MSAGGLRLALRFLRGNYARLTFTIAGVACGVAQVSGNDLVGQGALRAFVDVIDTMAGRAALQIHAGQGAPFPQDIPPAAATVAGVERLVPVVSGSAFTTDGRGALLSVQGMDLSDHGNIAVYEMEAGDGRFDDPKILLPDAIIVTRVFAERHALAVGMPLTLDTPRGRRRFVVRGLLEPHGVARLYEGDIAVMDLPGAQELFTGPALVSRIDVVVDRAAEIEPVAAALAAVVPAGLRVEAPAQRKADLHKVIHAFQVLLRALNLVGLGAGFLIAFNGLGTMYERRAWQIGILRAVGVRQGAVQRELVMEAAVVGLAGVALGIPMGIGMAQLLLPAITTAVAVNSNLLAPAAPLTLHLSSFVLGAGLGLLAALLGALLPAWRAARAGLAATLRSRDREQAGSTARSRWVVLLLVLATTAVAFSLHWRWHSAVWGVVTTGLVVLSAGLAARPLIDAAGVTLVPLVRSLAGPAAWLATVHVTQNRRRTSLTVAVLGVGLGAVLWMWTVAQSFERTLIDALTSAWDGTDLVVSSAHLGPGIFEAPVAEQLSAELGALPGITAVAGEREAEWHHGGGPVLIYAIDRSYLVSPEFGRWPLVGRTLPDPWQMVAGGEATIVSSNFALNLGARVGDVLRVQTPTDVLPLTVAAIATHFGSPRGNLIISRETYTRFWHDPQITRALVRTAAGADRQAVRAAITGTLGKTYSLQVRTAAEVVEYFGSRVRLAFAGLYILAGLVLFIVLVGMSDTLAAGVVERTREIGSLRVVGVRRHVVRRLVVLEGLALGIVGLLLAGVAGAALGALWVHVTFPSLLGWVIALHLPSRQAALTALLTVGACLVTAYFPARHAAALEPAEALRYE